MAKNKKTISRWDTGLVEGPNARDISDSASSNLTGLDPSKVGALKLHGWVTDAKNPSGAFTRVFGFLSGRGRQTGLPRYNSKGFGYGLMQFKSDRPRLGLHFSKKIGSNGEHSSELHNDIEAFNNNNGSTPVWFHSFMSMHSIGNNWTQQSKLIDSEPFAQWNGNSEDSGGTGQYYQDDNPDWDDLSGSEDRANWYFGRSMYVSTPRSTLYTVLWCHFSPVTNQIWVDEQSSILSSVQNSNASYASPTQNYNYNSAHHDAQWHSYYFGPLIHEYSLHDNGETTNSWYRPFRQLYEGCHTEKHDFQIGFTFNRRRRRNVNALGNLQDEYGTYPFSPDWDRLSNGEHAWNKVDLASTWQRHTRKNIRALNWPTGEYRPKFYYVDGYPRVYDETKSGMHWTMQYCRHGFNVNHTVTGQSGHKEYFRVNQWVIAPNYFYYLPTTTILAEGGIKYYPGVEESNVQITDDISISDAQGRTVMWDEPPSNSTPYTPDPPRGFFHFINRTAADTFTYYDGLDLLTGNPPRAKTIVNTQFMNSETGGWLAEHGKPTFWLAAVYDGTQQGPILNLSNRYSNSYPGMNDDVQDCVFVMQGLTLTNSGGFPEFGGNATVNPNNNVGAHIYQEGNHQMGRYPLGYRVTGYRIYYSYVESAAAEDGSFDTNTYLMVNVDWDKGYQISGDPTWHAFGHIDADGCTCPYPTAEWQHTFEEPPKFEDFALVNGYGAGDSINAQFRTAVYAKGRTWIGNVRVNGVDHEDRLMKSAIGSYGKAPDVFPGENYLEVLTSDGDSIQHLEYFKDKLMVFKTNALHVVDISVLDDEKVVLTEPGNGIAWYTQACQTRHGICWANSLGCFLYNGDEISNLLLEDGINKISQSLWQSKTGTDGYPHETRLSMQYSKKRDKLFIVFSQTADDAGGAAFIYNFGSQSWSETTNVFPTATGLSGTNASNISNMIQGYDGDIIMAAQDWNIDSNDSTGNAGAGAVHPIDGSPGSGQFNENNFGKQIKLKQWYEEDALQTGGFIRGNFLDYKTKDIEFDNLGSKKSIKKVYVTYKCNGYNGDSNIKITYGVDGDAVCSKIFSSTKSLFSDKISNAVGYTYPGGLRTTGISSGDTTGVFRTVELIPNTPSEAKKVNSFRLKFHNTGISAALTVGVDDGNATINNAVGDYITLTSVTGLKKTYILTAHEDPLGHVFSAGDYIDNGDAIHDTNATLASSAHHGSIAVPLNFGTEFRGTILARLKAAIEHENGHNGELVCEVPDSPADGAQTMIISQKYSGESGNTQSDLYESSGGGFSINTDFTGGTGDIAAWTRFEIDDITLIYREHSTK